MSLALLPYQSDAVEVMSHRRGTLLADDMGLGKTIQAIGLINAHKHWRQVLIVCPASLKLNWSKELDKWNESYAAIHITSYEGLGKLRAVPFDLVIIDEAHLIKTATTKRSFHCKRICKNAAHVLALTGTPVQKRPLELWALLQIVCPLEWDPAGMVYEKRDKKAPVKQVKFFDHVACVWRTRPEGRKTKMVAVGEGAGFLAFGKRYCDGKKNTLGNPENPNAKTFWTFNGATNLEELSERLYKTCMIRRLKGEVLAHLPPKRREIIVLPNARRYPNVLPDVLTAENYESVMAKIHADKVLFTEFSRQRLLQALDKVGYIIELLADEILEYPDTKLICFGWHTEVIQRIADELFMRGIKVLTMTGKTPIKERQRAVDLFQGERSNEFPIIIGSIGVMGVGWTLTKSASVVFAELSPLPTELEQAEDRAHRFGQENSVLIRHIVLNDSIDGRLAELLVERQGMICAIFSTSTRGEEKFFGE